MVELDDGEGTSGPLSNEQREHEAFAALGGPSGGLVTEPALAGAARGPVTVDDAAVFLARLSGGALGVFEATRVATGRKNALRIEVNGTAGSLAFDFEDMNVLQLFVKLFTIDPNG